jgi:hypothetical protein
MLEIKNLGRVHALLSPREKDGEVRSSHWEVVAGQVSERDTGEEEGRMERKYRMAEWEGGKKKCVCVCVFVKKKSMECQELEAAARHNF